MGSNDMCPTVLSILSQKVEKGVDMRERPCNFEHTLSERGELPDRKVVCSVFFRCLNTDSVGLHPSSHHLSLPLTRRMVFPAGCIVLECHISGGYCRAWRPVFSHPTFRIQPQSSSPTFKVAESITFNPNLFYIPIKSLAQSLRGAESSKDGVLRLSPCRNVPSTPSTTKQYSFESMRLISGYS